MLLGFVTTTKEKKKIRVFRVMKQSSQHDSKVFYDHYGGIYGMVDIDRSIKLIFS